MAMVQHPPGPAGHWLWGNLDALRTDTLGLLERVPRQYGEIASLRFASSRALLLSHPTWVEQVLVTESKKFQKPPRFRRIVQSAFGTGLFANEGSSWLAQRRRMQSALDQIPLDRYARTVVETARRVVAGWELDSASNLEPAVGELALAIRTRTTLGTDQTDALQSLHSAIGTFMDYFASSIQNPFSPPLWVPTPGRRRVRSAMNRWWRVIGDAIQQAADPPARHDCLLAILRDLRDAEGHPAMPARALSHEIATWLLTGTETLANTLCWTWYLLATRPRVCDKLFEELDATLHGSIPAYADLPQLKYTVAVLREAMRLYPQAYIIGRKSIEPFEMNEFKFPRGTTVVLNQWFIGRDPRWFDDPLEFRPERWLESGEPRPTFAYFPFGGGPRSCAGKTLAMLEMPLVLAAIGQRFDFRLASAGTVRPQPSLTLRPDPSLRVIFASR